MKRILAAMAVAATAFVSAQGQARTISKDEYRTAVLVLFDEFLQMKEDGVFLDQATIKALGPEYEFSSTIRGSHAPGGFFARPPGSEWVQRVKGLQDTGHKFVCFKIPELPSGMGICGFDLMSLTEIAGNSGDVSFLDAVVAKFWLATICHRSPEACEAFVAD